MKITKFVTADNAATLSDSVNELERQGWIFVSVQMAFNPRPSPDDEDNDPWLLATLQREEGKS